MNITEQHRPFDADSHRNWVVMSAGHSLLPEQESLLWQAMPQGWEVFPVPVEGMNLKQLRDQAERFGSWCANGGAVVFVSPVPALLLQISARCGFDTGWAACTSDETGAPEIHPWRVGVFHNDRRVAKELPDGKIIHTVAPTGWVIEWI
jgi:hypothetical protein